MIKNKIYISLVITLFCAQAVKAQSLPVYLDETKDIEVRVEDALKRMTLDEKIRVIHAQSKFSSAGVPRWDFLIFGQTTDLMVCVLMCCGTSGNKPGRRTTRVWLSPHSLALPLHGILSSR